MGFVDIHSHVLYGLDDGAKDREDTVAMLQIAANDGTTDIVATPHANSRYRFDPAAIDARLTELDGVAPLRVHRGADFRIQSNTLDDALTHRAKYTINGTQYLLVEFPEATVFAHTGNVLERLLEAGIVPIITHPERHRQLPHRLDDLTSWIGMGCLLQVTAASVTGRFGRTVQAYTRQMIARGLVQFVASDAHDTKRRPPVLSEAYGMLAEKWGEDAVQPMFTGNPRAVISGEAVNAVVQPLRSRRRRWYQVWR